MKKSLTIKFSQKSPTTVVESPQSEKEKEPSLVIKLGEPNQIDIRGSLYKSMNKAYKISYSKEFIRNMEQD